MRDPANQVADAILKAAPPAALTYYDQVLGMTVDKWLTVTLLVYTVLQIMLVVDGQLGPATIAGLKSVLRHRGADGAKVIARTLNCMQGARYLEITERNPQQEDFFYGWLLNSVSAA